MQKRLQSFGFRPSKPGFRSDIQAMRAVAVVGVFIYHLWPTRFTGGFLGVDVFFVISGFLMTSHLLNGLEGGGWKTKERIPFLTGFYFKRIRRLAPASLVALFSTAAIHWCLFREKAHLLSMTAEQLMASSLFGQNWKLAADAVDYLAQGNAATAVEHFWSLSVEEQFYFVWPMLLMGSVLIGVHVKRTERVNLTAISAITVLSLVYGLYLTKTDPAAAYFATPGRIWELSLGGIVAVLPGYRSVSRKLGGMPVWSRDVAAFAALAICVAAMYLLDPNEIAFPGYWALVPTVATGIILWTGTDQATLGSTLFDRISTLRPIQFIGDISYSFYLWHFIVIKTYYFYQLYFGNPYIPALKKALILVPLSLILATTSYYLVEKPFLRLKKRGATFAFAVIGTAVVIAISYGEYRYALENGAMKRALTNRYIQEAIDAISSGRPLTPNQCIGAIAVGRGGTCGASGYGTLDPKMLDDVERDHDLAVEKHCDEFEAHDIDTLCVLGDTISQKSILLWGDSHAMHFSDALDVAAKNLGYKLVVATRFSCPPLELRTGEPEVVHPNDPYWGDRYGGGCVERNKFVLGSDAYRNAELIILASVFFSDDTPAHRLFADNFVLLGNKSVAIIQDAPQIRAFGKDVPADEKNKISYMIRLGELSGGRTGFDLGNAFFRKLDDSGAHYSKIMTESNFCDDHSCYLAVGSLPIFRDDGHMSGTYSKTMGPFFTEALRRVLSYPNQ